MAHHGPDAPPAVPAVLPVQLRHRLAAQPVDAQVGVEEKLPTAFPHPPVELEVLIDRELFVPAAELASECHRVSAEGDVVNSRHGRAMVIGGAADAEGARHGGRDCPPLGRQANAVLASAHAPPRSGFEVFHRPADVIGWDRRVRVDAHEPGCLRLLEGEVE